MKVRGRRRDRNSITLSPLLTSPSLSSLSHLLSFPHICLLAIFFTPCPTQPSFLQISSHISPQLPSFVLKPHLLSFPLLLYPIAPTQLSLASPVPHPSSPFLYTPLLVLLFLICLESNLQTCTHTEKMNKFKRADRKH